MRLFLLILCLFLADGLTALAAEPFETEIKPFLEKYCVDCHSGGEDAKGDVDLSTMTASNFAERFEHWE